MNALRLLPTFLSAASEHLTLHFFCALAPLLPFLGGQDFNAKLSDFGLAREGPEGSRSHISTDIVGTSGYLAPEYVTRGEEGQRLGCNDWLDTSLVPSPLSAPSFPPPSLSPSPSLLPPPVPPPSPLYLPEPSFLPPPSPSLSVSCYALHPPWSIAPMLRAVAGAVADGAAAGAGACAASVQVT